MKKNKNALVIGGTGVIGIPTVMQLIKHYEYNVHTISLSRAENPQFPPTVKQHIVDRNTPEHETVVQTTSAQLDNDWDVVIDLIAFDDKSALQTYTLFKNIARHIITVSTTLVYDRSIKLKKPITEETPLAQEGELGGYVDGKLKLEKEN
ncbi:hypothetical protein KW783_02750 [Candidatus Parcubacteria bacterium]|nr:hypothetical protein [Candidatus Parcubacteria bacterium]